MSTKTNLTLDLTIFAAFLVVANPRLTGNSIHEWLSISFAAAIITHLLFHWDWIIKVGSEFIKKLFHQSRLNFAVDIAFFVAMVGAMLSGLMISKDILAVLGIELAQAGGSWKMIHSLSSDASIILLGIHTALHWKWIVTSFKRLIAAPLLRSTQAPAAQPQPQTRQVIRVENSK
jgi:hypothetical protein